MTNAPISQNPRVVKEADALSAAGYDVIVLFGQHAEWTRPLDRRILENAKWRGWPIEFWPNGVLPRIRRLALTVCASTFRILSKFSTAWPIAELAYSRLLPLQLWKATRQRADFYIGHNPQSLPVVAWAARYTGATYGFDFEDFHQGEISQDQMGTASNRLLTINESRYLRQARLITASSWGIAREVGRLHGLPEPVTVLNVFNWADRKQISSPVHMRGRQERLSLYWFSQIVSLDRGLQDVLHAMARLDEPVTLNIRGALTEEVKAELISIAQGYGIESWISFLEAISPECLVAAAAEHDIGLCLEVPTTPNKENCISNKMFIYILAGLAVVASNTRGHSDVLANSSDVGFLYESGDPDQLANIIKRLSRDRELLAQTKARALAAAEKRWNWEHESRTLVAAVDRVVLSARDVATKVGKYQV